MYETLDVWNLVNNGINYLLAGAGFLPSTLVLKVFHVRPALIQQVVFLDPPARRWCQPSQSLLQSYWPQRLSFFQNKKSTPWDSLLGWWFVFLGLFFFFGWVFNDVKKVPFWHTIKRKYAFLRLAKIVWKLPFWLPFWLAKIVWKLPTNANYCTKKKKMKGWRTAAAGWVQQLLGSSTHQLPGGISHKRLSDSFINALRCKDLKKKKKRRGASNTWWSSHC